MLMLSFVHKSRGEAVNKRSVAVLVMIVSLTSFARPEATALSGQVEAVTGGATISVTGTYNEVFNGIVNYLKRSGTPVDDADKDTGLIVTAMEFSGGKANGRRMNFSVLNDQSDHTMVRIAVSVQKHKGGGWGEPTVDDKASIELADKVQNDLFAQLGHN